MSETTEGLDTVETDASTLVPDWKNPPSLTELKADSPSCIILPCVNIIKSPLQQMRIHCPFQLLN